MHWHCILLHWTEKHKYMQQSLKWPTSINYSTTHTSVTISDYFYFLLLFFLSWVGILIEPNTYLTYSINTHNKYWHDSLPFFLTSNTMTTLSLIDVSVQLLKYSVKVSTTLCKNSITKSGGTEKNKQTKDVRKGFEPHPGYEIVTYV